jgi:molybdopterin molybdotransferase
VRTRLDEAQGLVLAQDVVADRDYPPFVKSLMDGYAVRAADVPAGGAVLKCAGEIAAGAAAAAREALPAGQTLKIMTGAPLPPGADAVVPVEISTAVDDARVRLEGPAVPWKFIARRGSDCPAGETVLTRGQKVGAAQLAVAASVGAAVLDVFARPRVAVLTTGDEIVPFDEGPGPSQIRNCNGIMLVALLCRLGCDVTDRRMVRDDPQLIRGAIARALESHDVLFVTGGMSMGDYDYVPRVLRELGAELKITKLRIKPGKPFVFATLGSGRFVFGLPGNPVSGFACTLRLGSRLLARLAGAQPREDWTDAPLDAPLPANGPREFYQPAQWTEQGSGPRRVRGLEWKSSGDVFTLARADCLIVRPENDPARPVGSVVRVLEIPS